MSQEMKIATILFAVVSTCAFSEGKVLRYRRGANDLKESYIVHYNNKGETLSVAGFEEFVRVLNRQQASPGLTASYFAENPVFPSRQSTPTTMSELMTTTESTIFHQPKPLSTGTPKTLDSIVTTTTSPGPAYVTEGSTASPLKLPHEMSGTSPMAEAFVSTGEPKLTLALGHDQAATLAFPGELSLSDVSNFISQTRGAEPLPSKVDPPSMPTIQRHIDFSLVTPGENSPSKMTVSSLKFPYGSGLTSKVISLQPGVQTVLNYAPPSVAIHGYNLPTAQTSYVQTLPTVFQKSYSHSAQPEMFNYASYPNQNIAIDGIVPLQIVRQEPSLIDIGQGLGQGYRSAPQELPLNLGGWGGVDYNGQRSIPLVKPVLGVANLGYTVPASPPAISKIGFGLGSW